MPRKRGRIGLAHALEQLHDVVVGGTGGARQFLLHHDAAMAMPSVSQASTGLPNAGGKGGGVAHVHPAHRLATAAEVLRCESASHALYQLTSPSNSP